MPAPLNLSLRSLDTCCSVLQCDVVWCSVVQCGAVWCSVLQCVAVCQCIYIFIYIHEYVCISSNINIWIYMCIYIYIYDISIARDIWITHVQMRVYKNICIFVYTKIILHMNTHIPNISNYPLSYEWVMLHVISYVIHIYLAHQKISSFCW